MGFEVDASIRNAMVGGPDGEVKNRGVSEGEARAIIAKARAKGVEPGEIASSFAVLGLGELYSRVTDRNAPSEARTASALSDASFAVREDRLTPAHIDTAVSLLRTLRSDIDAGRSFTRVNVGEDGRANQAISRANQAVDVANAIYRRASTMEPGPARDRLVAQANQLLDAAAPVLDTAFVRSNGRATSADANPSIASVTDRIATVRANLASITGS
ncbi:MAG: hypothetical protein IT381_13215 [Deltaproteobacteria bacterium]|nr:hypothetical protein [Deltaproteobacteria bacterium]